MAHEVFISHSSKDKVIADAVCSILEQNKIRCWIAPRDVTPGENYAKCIMVAIKQSKVMVVIFSSNANSSDAVGAELENAMRYGVITIPFRIENVSPSEDKEFFLNSKHWLDAITPPIEQHINKLSDTIKTFLSIPIDKKLSDTEISDEEILIDLTRIKNISENGNKRAINIANELVEEKQIIKVDLDFSPKSNFQAPVFLMALIKNIPSQDWSRIASKGYCLEFNICSNTSIDVLQLEIKSDYNGMLTKVVDMEIDTSDDFRHYSLKLQDFVEEPIVWTRISEICFTCFSYFAKEYTGSFTLSDLRLVVR